MVSPVDTRDSHRLATTLVVGAGIVLAAAAVLLSGQGGPLSFMFRHGLFVGIMAGICVWNPIAWAARRVIVGKQPELCLSSTLTSLWGGFRVALLVAVVTLLVFAVAALAIGLGVGATLVKAIVLVMFVAAITGITAGAIFNSMLVVRHWRGHKA